RSLSCCSYLRRRCEPSRPLRIFSAQLRTRQAQCCPERESPFTIWTPGRITAVSNPSGEYIVTLLPVGHYSIRVVASGFKTLVVPEVTLAIGDRLRQDVRLEVGALQQSVEVTASSPALQTDSSSLS